MGTKYEVMSRIIRRGLVARNPIFLRNILLSRISAVTDELCSLNETKEHMSRAPRIRGDGELLSWKFEYRYVNIHIQLPASEIRDSNFERKITYIQTWERPYVYITDPQYEVEISASDKNSAITADDILYATRVLYSNNQVRCTEYKVLHSDKTTLNLMAVIE